MMKEFFAFLLLFFALPEAVHCSRETAVSRDAGPLADEDGSLRPGETDAGGGDAADETGPCALPSRSGGVRAFAVQLKQEIESAADAGSFRKKIFSVMQRLAPELSRDDPNLVVLPEYSGYMLAFSGGRGMKARERKDTVNAFADLLDAYRPQWRSYMARYRDISIMRALMLSLADTMWRPFNEVFSSVARDFGVYLVVSTPMPDIDASVERDKIEMYGDPDFPDRDEVFLPRGKDVYNFAFLYDPCGKLFGKVKKVNLTEVEKNEVDLSAGKLEEVEAFDLPIGRTCVAVCLDTFVWEYIAKLDSLRCEFVIQVSANPGRWANDASEWKERPELWQPQDWLGSTLGSIQPFYANNFYNISAMLVGNLFDIPFDGQSAITRKASGSPQRNFVGNDGFSGYEGEFLAMAPWVMDDPALSDPSLSVEERRLMLSWVGAALAPGSASPIENQYVETHVYADLEIH